MPRWGRRRRFSFHSCGSGLQTYTMHSPQRPSISNVINKFRLISIVEHPFRFEWRFFLDSLLFHINLDSLPDRNNFNVKLSTPNIWKIVIITEKFRRRRWCGWPRVSGEARWARNIIIIAAYVDAAAGTQNQTHPRQRASRQDKVLGKLNR